MKTNVTLIGLETKMEADPEVQHFRDVVYIPVHSVHAAPGLYTYQRKVVTTSIYSRGPDVNGTFPGLGMQISYNDVTEYAPDEIYLYLGAVHDHFGHFLLSTMSRLWHPTLQDGSTKIVCIFNGNLKAELEKPYVKKILGALGLAPERFVVFSQPVRLRNVLLPVASFEERNYAHRAFARLGNRVGSALAGRSEGARALRPAYFSKSKLRHGVRAIVTERELEDVLEGRGVTIVHPQEHSFEDQIRLWDEFSVISFAASSLHSSIFRPGRKITSILYDDFLDTSFTLIDWANENESTYFALEESEATNDGVSPHVNAGVGFHTNMRLKDPKRIAEQILDAIY